MSRRRDEPIPLSEALGNLRRELGVADVDLLARVEAIWRSVVPAHLVARSAVQGMRAGRLVVTAQDPAIAAQLRYCERQVLEACESELGHATVSRVDFVVTSAHDANDSPR